MKTRRKTIRRLGILPKPVGLHCNYALKRPRGTTPYAPYRRYYRWGGSRRAANQEEASGAEQGNTPAFSRLLKDHP